jgi:mono/diheme cytochrome c family protein
MFVRWLASLLFALALPCLARAAEATPQQEEFFEKQVRPVLAEHCWKCHGPTKQESELRLDSPAAMARGGASGEKLLSANAGESYLLKVVKHEGDVKMPPESKLSDEQIASLAGWISQGAPWPKSIGAEPTTLSALERVGPHRREHWAYQPVARPAVPAAVSGWSRSDIDRFVEAKLSEKGLTPSPEADRRTLIRRLTFDLHGLPPTFEEVESFAADEAPNGYERLVDRLLASPRYGERWGRHWLDVARYADTMGYAFDRDRRYPYAYTYRDYVIDALNRDLPYDRFVLEQIAADQLEGVGPASDPRPLAALGFITVGRKFIAIQDTYDDQVDVVMRGLQGLTVGCARCHDHKYDAIPSEDYYSLYGVFANCNEPPPQDLPLIAEPSQAAGYAEFQQELAKLQGEVDKYVTEKRAEVINTARAKTVDYLVRVANENLKDDLLAKLSFLSLKPEEVRRRLIERWRDYLKDRAKPEHPTLGLWAELTALPGDGFAQKAAEKLEAWKARPVGLAPGSANNKVREAFLASPPQERNDVARIYGQLLTSAWESWKAAGANDAALDKLDEETRQLALMMVAKDAPTEVPADQIRQVFNRAERDHATQLEQKVRALQVNSPVAPPRAMVLRDREKPEEPRVLIRGNVNRPGKQVARQFPVVLTLGDRKPFTHQSGRLDLARQIVDPSNPLTRRVIVNRLWMEHFGEPLVDTPSDFGVRTPRPVHAELLDNLATYLLDQGWSLKALHRYLVTSATYRQASHDRPECAAVDPENRLLWKMNRRRLEWEALRDSMLYAAGRLDAATGGRPVELTNSPFPLRRTIYGNIDRQDLPNLFRVFDIASPDQSSPRRPRTTIPQQSLFLMNSPFSLEQGQALASRAEIAAASEPRERILRLYQAALGRRPTDREINLAQQFVDRASQDPAGAQLNPWEQLAQLLLMTNEFAYVD